jgi:hypothetical protein
MNIWSKEIAQRVHLWHTARPKWIPWFQQKHIFPAQRPLESHWSTFESAWMTLADSTVAQRQALGTICSGGGGLQHQYIGFQDDSRGSRHCVGFAWDHRLYLAQSVQPESTGWRPASRQSRVFTAVGVTWGPNWAAQKLLV